MTLYVRLALVPVAMTLLTACNDEPLTDPPTEEEVQYCQDSLMTGSALVECGHWMEREDHWRLPYGEDEGFTLEDCNMRGLHESYRVDGFHFLGVGGIAAWVDYSASPPTIQITHLSLPFLGYEDLPDPGFGFAYPGHTGVDEDGSIREGIGFDHGEYSQGFGPCNYWGSGEMGPSVDGGWMGTVAVQDESGRRRADYVSDEDFFQNSSGHWCQFEPTDIELRIPGTLDEEAGIEAWSLPSGIGWNAEDEEIPCLGTEIEWSSPVTGWNGIARLYFSEPDLDHDGVADREDNCPDVFNPAEPQEGRFNRSNGPGPDSDDDGEGDACDPDDDNDDIPDEEDLCPFTPGEDNGDADGDGIGNACDDDSDNDGIEDEQDLCPLVASEDNGDSDGDGIGNPCDDDADNDGLTDDEDLCPGLETLENGDVDGDGLGDPCDDDSDNDGVSDDDDNCPDVANAGQEDADFDHAGTACDPGEVAVSSGPGFCLGDLTFTGSVQTDGGCTGALTMDITIWADGIVEGLISLVPNPNAACLSVQNVPFEGAVHQQNNGQRTIVMNGVLEGIGGPGVDYEATFAGSMDSSCMLADGTVVIPAIPDSGTWDIICSH